jgi:iron(III) transport system substrate-binding protein
VSFIHDAVTEAVGGFPVKSSTPCEGTGYEIGSMSIMKGAKNLDAAKKFYDWALTAPAQEIAGATKQFQVPSNKAAKLNPLAPDFSKIKLINYDSAKYGASAERKRLLDRWERDVGGAK